jgi:hypothetical protein
MWVVEVSFKTGNPPHQAIGLAEGEGHWQLFRAGYGEVPIVYVPEMVRRGGYFKCLKRIEVKP